jgi:hypothetical protein
MTIDAVTLVLTDLEAGRFIAAGLIAIEARYASRWPAGADRPERLHPGPKLWRAIADELATVVNPGPLPRQSWLWLLMTGGHSGLSVQYLSLEPIEIASPDQTAAALDARLRAVRP